MKLICSWCHKEFTANVTKDEDGERGYLTCSNCGRLLPSSKIESTESLVGRKHFHSEFKEGDIA